MFAKKYKKPSNTKAVKESLFEYVSNSITHQIINAECLTVLRNFEDEKFDLIITSPPYNIGKSYEIKTNIEQYLQTQEEVIFELVRTLSSHGSLCWQVGNFVDRGEVFPLDVFYYHIFKKHGLKLRNRIIWHFGHGLHASKRFSGRYETILWFTKSDKYTFNLDDVRVPSKYPGKRHFKGAKKGLPSGNPLGKNPSDLWEILIQDWERELWNIPNVKSNHPEKTSHPCQFPIELVERCIERDSGYCKTARQRVKDLREGKLRFRPINKPIHKPSESDKVSQVPNEWLEFNFANRLHNLYEDRSEILPSKR